MSNSDQIALGTSDGRILLYCLITGTLDQSLDLSQSPEVDAHAAVIFGDLAYNRSNSFLVFIFKYVENGREEEETHLRNDTATSKLACWDLKSSQVEILRTFPSDCKLSRDAMFVAYNVYQANKTSLWYYDIRHSHNFALHTRNEFIVDSAFAITGAVIAIWWDSDFIEVWDLEKQSCLGVIEHQRSPIAYTYMVLSQHGDILAIALDNCDPSINEVEVFEVKTGSLLWSKADRKQVGFESWEACTFLEDTPNMAINCMNSIRIYDAYTGTVIDEMDSLLQHHEWSSKPLHCGKQLAFISYDTVELLDLFTEISGPSTSMMLYKPFAIRGEILITNVIDKLHETEWYEDCKFDTGECVWKSPAFPRKLFDQRYRRTNSNHFIERQHRTVVISHLNGTSLQKHSTFDIPEEAEMTCSPGGFYIVLWQQDFTSIYDIESRTMTTDLTSSVMISGLSCGVELDQDQRKDFARPQWSLEGERLVKEVKKGLLMWSKEKGFQKFALDIRGQLRLSSCGTWLACCIPQAIDPVPNLLESPERLHHHKLQIYHVETKEIRSVLDIGMNYRDWDCLYCNLEIAFLPDKQQILILGESWQLWSFSGCSGERLCYIPIANHYTAFTQFTSPTDLETNRGIISLSDNEIRLGSVDRPFEHGSEIYINNYKVLQLPLYYNFWHLVYSTGRLALTGGGRGRITTLDFSISHASESEREAFHETHKAVTTS